MPTAFPLCLESVLQVPLGNWTVLRLGEGQCDVTESCVERMRAGEKCEVSLKTWLGGGGGSGRHWISFPLLLSENVMPMVYHPKHKQECFK